MSGYNSNVPARPQMRRSATITIDDWVRDNPHAAREMGVVELTNRGLTNTDVYRRQLARFTRQHVQPERERLAAMDAAWDPHHPISGRAGAAAAAAAAARAPPPANTEYVTS